MTNIIKLKNLDQKLYLNTVNKISSIDNSDFN